jgi:hypothetical protein
MGACRYVHLNENCRWLHLPIGTNNTVLAEREEIFDWVYARN